MSKIGREEYKKKFRHTKQASSYEKKCRCYLPEPTPVDFDNVTLLDRARCGTVHTAFRANIRRGRRGVADLVDGTLRLHGSCFGWKEKRSVCVLLSRRLRSCETYFDSRSCFCKRLFLRKGHYLYLVSVLTTVLML